VTECCHAKLLQVLFRQTRKNHLINLVLAEGPLIPFEAKAPQPTPEVHDIALNGLSLMIVQPGQSVQRSCGMPKSESGQPRQISSKP
jgi:hypothetical protein